MKRAALMAIVVLSAGFAAGCERNDSTSSYDPKLDGVKPPAFKRPDESILDNQKDIPSKSSGGSISNVTVPSTPAATTAAPATSTGVEATTAPASDKAAPATPAGGDMTPPPPG